MDGWGGWRMTSDHPLFLIMPLSLSFASSLQTTQPLPTLPPVSALLLGLATKVFVLHHLLVSSMRAIPPGQSQDALLYPEVAVSFSRARMRLSCSEVAELRSVTATY